MAAAMMTTTEIAGFVGAGLAGVAYVPQIYRLRKTRCSAGISQLAFGIWLLASLLTTARAITIHAGVFIMLGGTQIVATALIMLYATRYKDTPCLSPSASRVKRHDSHRAPSANISCRPHSPRSTSPTTSGWVSSTRRSRHSPFR